MAKDSKIEQEIQAVVQAAQPQVSGTIISEDDDSIVLKSHDAIIEIPVRHVAHRKLHEGNAEVTLTPDARILVGAVVSAKHGFVGDNVFGGLLPHLLADNCNCNCNCGGGNGGNGKLQASELRRPFTGGARRTWSD